MLEIVEGTEDFTDLQVDFAKLFVGPDRLLAAPYGSVYLDGGRRVMGDSTMAALAFYDKIGLQMSKEQKELPDHIEVELEVMYFLLYKERTLRKEDNAELADAYLADIKEFLTEQIGAWVDAFVGDVEKEAEQEFYKLLADVTRTLIAEEKQRFLNKDLH
ncbi:hypothetical protein BHU72_10320 [Desulfuribacillus stibiiarsenatis]|uniref:Dehydrogenase n=2 Tax=Desulfuribacillus stibiiarsenatis TaxID=1390249 RepID=A0A1E5L965_9FIRM|nr:hypothetical protein BHU72_10320 [Desulfuribacillus stibiiarsenatis]